MEILMADLQFSQQEIEDLAQKLSRIQPSLSERESTLLLAIFAAAADRAKRSDSGGGATLPWFEIRNPPPPPPGAGEQVTLTDLQQQLLNAYIPGNDFNFASAPKVVAPPPPSPSPPPKKE
jgi:hypothetical protein